MAEAKKTSGFLMIERHEGTPDRMTFHETDAGAKKELDRALQQNEMIPPPLSETDRHRHSGNAVSICMT